MDFPNIKLVKVNMKFYLLNDDGSKIMKNFDQCGSEALENSHYAF